MRDQSGGIVVGANLEIRNRDTGITRKASSNERGEYTAPDLVPGPYDITVTHSGFRAVRQADIVLEMDQVARVDIKLEVGAVSQTVEVIETGAPLVNTDNGAKGQVMTDKEIILGFLVAGVTANTTNLQGSSFAINGNRPDNTNFIIDGFGAREPLFGAALTSPNLDALQEFNMQTNNFSAEYGRMAGGVINMGITGVQNPMCLSCDRARSDWDIGHMFTMSFSWQSPVHNLLLRGWEFAGTSRINTGNPFTPVNTGANLNLGEANRPNRLGKGTVPNPNPSEWFNVADFPIVPDGSYVYGNSGRNILDGPGTISVNQTLYRNFRLREHGQLQLRHHANFQLPVNNVPAANAGTLTSVVSPGRQIQFGARPSF